MPVYIIDRYNKSLHLHTCKVVFLTPIYSTDRQPYVLRAEAHASGHPLSMCFTCSTGREVHWGRGGKKVREGDRQRKGGEKGDLSEACVRGIPCWCQFHSSSSMLRSFSLPQRDQLVLRERAGGRGRDKSNRNNREASAGIRWDRKTEGEWYVNIAFHAAVVSNYMRAEFCMCSIST